MIRFVIVVPPALQQFAEGYAAGARSASGDDEVSYEVVVRNDAPPKVIVMDADRFETQ